MNLPLPLAMSFPAWTCNRCRMTVEWIDALVLDDEVPWRVVHRECPAVTE